MALFKGKLFAGALFAGALLGGDQTQIAPPQPVYLAMSKIELPDNSKRQREDDSLLLLLM